MKIDLDRPIVDTARIGLGEAHAALERKAREVIAKEILPREHEESDAAGVEMVRALGAAGLLDACVDLDVESICLLRELVGEASGLADSMLALQGLGYGPIALAGSPAQKAEWRERVRTGEAVAAIGITEPQAGSDVGSMSTRATKDGDDYVLSGTKCFITNAGIADLYE